MNKEKLFYVGCLFGYVMGVTKILFGFFYTFLTFNPEVMKSLDPFWTFGEDELLLFIAPNMLLALGGIDLTLFFYGIRKNQKWTWFLYLFILIIYPIHITHYHFKLGIFPGAIITLGLLVPALILTYPHLFSKKEV